MPDMSYTPGVCNIGPEEIARRRRSGWFGVAVTILLFAILFFTRVNHFWRLLTFFPAVVAASGFLQAYFHFCAGFARRGIFNFGNLSQTQEITDEAAKAADRKKGNKISLYAILIAAVVAVIAFVV